MERQVEKGGQGTEEGRKGKRMGRGVVSVNGKEGEGYREGKGV